MTWPNVYILGASKCGTTSLAHQLSKHSDVFVVNGKETHFLTNPDKYQQGKKFYRKNYLVGATSQKVIIDATPEYFAKPDIVIPRLLREHDNASNLKFIVLLRDPVDRLVSHFEHRTRTFNEVREVGDAVLADMRRDHRQSTGDWSNYFAEGLYFFHLSRWFENFKADNFLILTLTQMNQNNVQTMRKIFNFLNIDDDASLHILEKRNIRSKSSIPAVTHLIARDWPLKRYLKLIVSKHQRRALAKWIHVITQVPTSDKLELDYELRKRIIEGYQSDVDELRRADLCDTSDWKHFES